MSELKELFNDDYTSVFKVDGIFGKGITCYMSLPGRTDVSHDDKNVRILK